MQRAVKGDSAILARSLISSVIADMVIWTGPFDASLSSSTAVGLADPLSYEDTWLNAIVYATR